MGTERRLWVVVQPVSRLVLGFPHCDDELVPDVGPAPFDAPDEAAVRAEVEATVGRFDSSWRIVPLTPELEAELRRVGRETIQ